MSEVPPTPAQVPIPESLRMQLEEFRRVLWRVKVLEAVVAGVIGLLLSFLVVYGLDRLWATPGWVRLVVLIGGTSLFAVFAPFWIHRWVWGHRREDQLARLIAGRFPGLGDRLLGVIELQRQHESAESMSPRLRAAAMEAVAAEAATRTLKEAMPPLRHRQWALGAVVLVAVTAAVLIVTPRAGTNALRRWLMPLADTPRYSFTILDSPPKEIAVPFGESFEVVLHLASDSEQSPATGAGRYGLQPQVHAVLEGRSYRFQFPGQQDAGTVVFRIGDARHELKVLPVQRPAAEGAVARVKAPDYLKIGEKTVELTTGVVSVVEGSEIEIRLAASRALKTAMFGPTVAAATHQELGEKEVAFEAQAGEMVLNGHEAVTPLLPVGKTPFEIPFDWTDSYGLSGGGFKVRVDVLADGPPVAYLQGIERQKVILPEETVDFEALAEDDFGLKTVGLEWRGEFTSPTDEVPAQGEMTLSEGGPEQRRFTGPVAFSPGAFDIPPQKLTLRAYVEDYLPGRPRVYSEPVILYVLSRSEHAQMLKNQFDRAITELEDLARREGNQLEENERLDRLDGEELQKEENRRRLEAQQQAEAESARRMQELSERLEKLMKDSARNGQIDKETLKKLAESMKDVQELAKEDLPSVESKLGEAGEQTNTPEKTDKDVAEAVEKQEKALEKMQAAVDKANEANRRFEAGTFVSRLKKAAGEEDGIVSVLKSDAEKIFGLKISEVDPSDQRRLEQSARQQGDTAVDVRWIQEDLGHYFTRTSKAPFKEILDEMQASKIDLGMEEVRTKLLINKSALALEGADQWSSKLKEWAKKLEGEMNKDGGGGGGGGGGPSPEDEDFEFMLRVMKMVQQETDIRAQTRALEQLRRSRGNQPFTPEDP